MSDFTLSYNFCLHTATKPEVVTDSAFITVRLGYVDNAVVAEPGPRRIQKRPLALCSVGPQIGIVMLCVFDIFKPFQ